MNFTSPICLFPIPIPYVEYHSDFPDTLSHSRATKGLSLLLSNLFGNRVITVCDSSCSGLIFDPFGLNRIKALGWITRGEDFANQFELNIIDL